MIKQRDDLNLLCSQSSWLSLRGVMVLAASLWILLIWAGGGMVETGQAQGQAMVSIEPASQEIAIGGTTTAEVRIRDVTDLYGAEVHLSFDPAVMEVVDANLDAGGVQVELGDFLSPGFVAQNRADNAAGTIDVSLTQVDPSEPVSGAGTLALITFRGKRAGVSSVGFVGVMLSDRNGVEIPASVQDGLVAVRAEAELPSPTFTPPPAATPTPLPTATPEPTPTPVSAEPTATPVPAEPTATPVPAEPTATPTPTPMTTPKPKQTPTEPAAPGATPTPTALEPPATPEPIETKPELTTPPTPTATPMAVEPTTTPEAAGTAIVAAPATPTPTEVLVKKVVPPGSSSTGTIWMIAGAAIVLIAAVMFIAFRRIR